MADQKLVMMSVALKLLLPVVTIVFIILRFRAFGPDWREKLGLCRPWWLGFCGFVLLSLVFMLGTNAMWGWRGPWDFTEWRNATLAHNVGRVLAVSIFGPISEELIFRGAAYFVIARKLGPVWAVVITGLIFGAIHYHYGWQDIALICVNGLLLGLARWKTGSLWTSIAMHITWNLYAIW